MPTLITAFLLSLMAHSAFAQDREAKTNPPEQAHAATQPKLTAREVYSKFSKCVNATIRLYKLPLSSSPRLNEKIDAVLRQGFYGGILFEPYSHRYDFLAGTVVKSPNDYRRQSSLRQTLLIPSSEEVSGPRPIQMPHEFRDQVTLDDKETLKALALYDRFVTQDVLSITSKLDKVLPKLQFDDKEREIIRETYCECDKYINSRVEKDGARELRGLLEKLEQKLRGPGYTIKTSNGGREFDDHDFKCISHTS